MSGKALIYFQSPVAFFFGLVLIIFFFSLVFGFFVDRQHLF